ncbi:MAG: aquaporin Z [Rhodobacteraceae bacterium]|nr:aquaporin Z [Paracoccaceae bacterium]
MQRKLLAELIGTFWLVFGGCGSALLAAGIPDLGIGFAGVALAFGLTVLTGVYAVGSISGGHFNPAVSLGLMLAGRFESAHLIPYWVAQVIGSVLAATLLYVIVSGAPGFVGAGGFASNGYGAASPGGFSFLSCAVTEITMTAVFIFVILGATSKGAPVGFAGIAIGLCLTLIHLVSIPVTNTSVNPARSTGVALFADGPALAQLWFFWVMPLIGAVLGALIWKLVAEPAEAVPPAGTTAQV